MSTVSSFITVLHKRSLEHTTVKVSRKKYYEVNFKSNKNKKLEIHAKYLIHANIYKHKVFVIRYKQYISYIAAIAEF